MNAVKNSVQLMGFLGSNPEIITYGENQSLARVSVATNERYKNKAGEWIEDTQWHRLVCWGKHAQFAKDALKKGMHVAAEGRLVNRLFEDKDGVVRSVTEIRVNEINLIERPEKSAAVLTND